MLGVDIGKCLLTMGMFCNIQFYFVAQNNFTCDLMSGQILDNLMNGHGTVKFFTPDGAICQGNSYVTYTPRRMKACVGQEGNVHATCSDGRKMYGHWTVTDSCSVGNGTVYDNMGNNYQVTFGYTAKSAVQQVNALRDNLGCPAIKTNGARMEVKGQVLRTE